VRAPAAWQHALLRQAGLDVMSAEWRRLQEGLIDPRAVLSRGRAAVLMVNGTSDEFFPLTAHRATYEAVAGERRTSLSGNFDHGCYKVSGVESARTIEERATLRAEGGQRLWFGHFLGTDARLSRLPQPPQLQLAPAGAATAALALVDPAGYEVEEVRLWMSNDAIMSCL
jgi:hypothetical protein